MKAKIFAGLGLALCLTTLQAHAGTSLVSSGTGFFVSNRGHIITNEHVVRGCKEVKIRGAVDSTTAKVSAIDTENDLALLQTDAVPSRIATISANGARLKVGEQVLVMGYPLDHGITGDYVTVESRVISLTGPLGEEKWIEFASSAEHGNSGGPLLDSGGNVIGVIVGKATLTRMNNATLKQEAYKESDVAISLPKLEGFLKQNRVYYRTQSSGFS